MAQDLNRGPDGLGVLYLLCRLDGTKIGTKMIIRTRSILSISVFISKNWDSASGSVCV